MQPGGLLGPMDQVKGQRQQAKGGPFGFLQGVGDRIEAGNIPAPLGGHFLEKHAPESIKHGADFFQEAAANLMMTDPDLADDIKARARSLDMQSKQMAKLMQIGAAMGEDVSSLGPIVEQLQQQRQKAFRDLIGRANVPTSASKPGKPDIKRPRM